MPARWEEPRDCTWPHASPARPARRPGDQSLYQRWQGERAPTLQCLVGPSGRRRPWPIQRGTWVPPSQPQAPEEQESALLKSLLPSDQLKETTEASTSHNSDLWSGAGVSARHGPQDRLGH